MIYFSVSFPKETRLGLNVIERGPKEPFLGHTLVENVPDVNGFAHKKGIQAGDFFVSVDDRYVAYLSHEQCIETLQSVLGERRGIKIVFARPVHGEWDKYRTKGDAIIREGILVKSSGILRRKVSRYVRLTRTKIYFSKENNESKSFHVSSLRLNGSQYKPSASSNFTVGVGSSDLELDAGDSHSCVLWQHSIHVSIHDVYSKELPEFYSFGRMPEKIASRKEKKPTQPPKYHEAVSKSKSKSERPSSSRSISRVNPFGMLSLCAVELNREIIPDVQIRLSDGKILGESSALDPKNIYGNFSYTKYDFHIEKSILNTKS